MMNQLTLNETVKSILNTEENEIWNYFLENKTDELPDILPGEAKEHQTRDNIIKELLTDGNSETLANYDFETIKEGNAILFVNMVRLVLALDINGSKEEIKEKVLDKLLDSMSAISELIRKESAGYPRKPMNALVWTEGAGMRSGMAALAYYFKEKDDTDHLHFAIMKRTGITLAIMGHYKHLVGPDMIEAGLIKEKLGENDTAIGFYEAVRDDFAQEIDWFVATPEAGPNEEDVITLESLKKAYLALDRLKGTDDYADQCTKIDEILSREHFEEPDFSDDDEDDEE